MKKGGLGFGRKTSKKKHKIKNFGTISQKYLMRSLQQYQRRKQDDSLLKKNIFGRKTWGKKPSKKACRNSTVVAHNDIY